MLKYKVTVNLEYSMTPYIPAFALLKLDIWKLNIAPRLIQCGFRHLDDCLVLGTEQNLIEFKMNWVDIGNYRLSIKEVVDMGIIKV